MARPVGSNGREAARLKSAVMAAFDKSGGVEYLVQQAKENPTAFMSMLAKILPKDVNVGGQANNPIVTENVHDRIRELATRLGIASIAGSGVREEAESGLPNIH